MQAIREALSGTWPAERRQSTDSSNLKETNNNLKVKHNVSTFLAKGYQIAKDPPISSVSIAISEPNWKTVHRQWSNSP